MGAPLLVVHKKGACGGCQQEDAESWQGTRPDGSSADMAGVTISGVSGGQIAWTHFYMEPVDRQGADIDAPVRRQAGGQ